MALQNAMRVIDGKVQGAYAPQAKNVSYKNGTVEDKLDELDNRASANEFGEPVNIVSYASSSNQYEFTSDGYINVSISGSTSYIIMLINGSAQLEARGELSYNSCFVKKGMKAYVQTSSGTFYAKFLPLIGSALPSAESEGF